MEIVDSLPKRTRTRKYDFKDAYATLLKNPGQACKLEKGEDKDFDCDVTSIRQYLYTDCRNLGLKCEVRVPDEDTVIFSVSVKQED